MLHSHSFQEKAFDSFAAFLRHVLKGDEKYEHLVEPILIDAILLAKKEKDYFSVSRDSFDVIVFLAEKDPSFLSRLDPQAQNQSKATYEKILSLITSQRSVMTTA